MLSTSDLALVTDVVESVADLRSRDDLFLAMLAGIVRAVPCSVATVTEVDPSADRVAYWADPASFDPPEGSQQLLAELANEHPVISYMAKTGDGSVRAISDFWSSEQYHASRLYRDLYAPMGVEHQVAFGLPVPLPVVLGVVVNRAPGEKDFSARDRAVLDALRPQLALAWRNTRDQERLLGLLDAASAAAGQLGWGVIVLSDPPEELTPGAFQTLEHAFGRARAGSCLPPRVARWAAGQAAVHGDPHGLVQRRPLSTEADGRRVVVQYLAAGTRHPGAIVVREERRSEIRHSFESLGLTKREAEIVRLVTLGESNMAIAQTLSVAPGTVKKHLDNVYTKLGVRSRGALTAFVLDLSGM